MAARTKANRPAEGLSNPYKLPRGERLRRELVAVFRAQRRAILRYLRTGKKDAGVLDRPDVGDVPVRHDRGHLRIAPHPGGAVVGRKDQPPPVPFVLPDFHDFGLGALDMARRMTPLLTLAWEAAAAQFAPRVGLDPDAWDVVNPHTERMIEEAALAFSQSTNDTTSKQLDAAIQELRTALNQGVVQQGEALGKLTARVGAIFDGAETWRARRIAWTETSRAVHAAQEQAAIHSGVVAGWRWLASADACPICYAIAARCPSVPLGRPFAVIGDDPNYSTIQYPPAHPLCNCSMVEILDADPQPQWGMTLHDPDPATDEETDRVAADLAAQYESILAPPKSRPAPARRAAPLARKRRRTTLEVA